MRRFTLAIVAAVTLLIGAGASTAFADHYYGQPIYSYSYYPRAYTYWDGGYWSPSVYSSGYVYPGTVYSSGYVSYPYWNGGYYNSGYYYPSNAYIYGNTGLQLSIPRTGIQLRIR